LEKVFLSRAGIKPTATSDEMFEGGENGSDGDEDYFSNADGTDNEDDLADAMRPESQKSYLYLQIDNHLKIHKIYLSSR
jgi:hypothetical protein